MSGPSPRTRRPTQSDVAAVAGVSRTVVSAIIRGPQAESALRISPPTRERVLAAIQETGYTPNMAARSLASGRNDIIGVFTYDPVFPVESGNYYHPILVGIEDEADRIGHSLLLSNARKDHGQRAIFHARANSLRVADGVIVIGTTPSSARDELAQLYAEQFPCVIVGRRDLPGTEPSWVAPDYAAGTRHAMDSLIEHGHRRIGYVLPATNSEPVQDRQQGMLAAATAAGLDGQVTYLRLGSGTDLLQQVVDHRLTAVLSAANSDAADLLAAARAAGIPVPEQLSVISLGGTPPATAAVDVAQLRIPHRELGRRAVEALLALLDGSAASPLRVLLDCDLDLGSTVGPAPRSS